MALTALGRRLPEQAEDLRGEVARLEDSAQNLSEAVWELSHELHPAVLEHAGLVPALRSCCREFGNQYEMTLLLADDIGPVLPATALCLCRATQEALRNVVKHAGARRVRVALGRVGSDLALSVVDDGCGFDSAEARRRGGLGLQSLEERARLVGGQLTITSHPQQGTEIRVVVPLPDN